MFITDVQCLFDYMNISIAELVFISPVTNVVFALMNMKSFHKPFLTPCEDFLAFQRNYDGCFNVEMLI